MFQRFGVNWFSNKNIGNLDMLKLVHLLAQYWWSIEIQNIWKNLVVRAGCNIIYIKAGYQLARDISCLIGSMRTQRFSVFLSQDFNAKKMVIFSFHRCRLERYGKRYYKVCRGKNWRNFIQILTAFSHSCSTPCHCNMTTCTLPCV